MQSTESQNFFKKYIMVAPLALSIVRGSEASLFSAVKLVPPVLDIGCGEGLFLSILTDQKIDVGLDLSGREIRRAARRGNYKKLVTSNANNIPYPDGYFNTIVSNCVFEHVKNPLAAFKEICRVLSPNGIYAFTAHSDLYNDYLFFPKLFKSLKLNFLAEAYTKAITALFRHYNCFSPEKWSRLLTEAGFKSIQYDYYLPQKSLELFDKLLFLSAPAYFNKKLFSRWVILPRIPVWKIWGPRIQKYVITHCDQGGALFITARKNKPDDGS